MFEIVGTLVQLVFMIAAAMVKGTARALFGGNAERMAAQRIRQNKVRWRSARRRWS